jgi:hypothetical protein
MIFLRLSRRRTVPRNRLGMGHFCFSPSHFANLQHLQLTQCRYINHGPCKTDGLASRFYWGSYTVVERIWKQILTKCLSFLSGWKISVHSWKQRMLQGVNLVTQQRSAETNSIFRTSHDKQTRNNCTAHRPSCLPISNTIKSSSLHDTEK